MRSTTVLSALLGNVPLALNDFHREAIRATDLYESTKVGMMVLIVTFIVLCFIGLIRLTLGRHYPSFKRRANDFGTNLGACEQGLDMRDWKRRRADDNGEGEDVSRNAFALDICEPPDSLEFFGDPPESGDKSSSSTFPTDFRQELAELANGEVVPEDGKETPPEPE